MGIMDRVRAWRGGAGSNTPEEAGTLHDRPANAGGEIPGHVAPKNREMGPEEAALRRKMDMAVPEGAKTPAEALGAARAEAAREAQARSAVLNAERTSNTEMPRSAAVATELSGARRYRKFAGQQPELADGAKAGARVFAERAREANTPGGGERLAARGFVGAEIARAGRDRQFQPKQVDGQHDGDRQAKRSRMSQGTG